MAGRGTETRHVRRAAHESSDRTWRGCAGCGLLPLGRAAVALTAARASTALAGAEVAVGTALDGCAKDRDERQGAPFVSTARATAHRRSARTRFARIVEPSASGAAAPTAGLFPSGANRSSRKLCGVVCFGRRCIGVMLSAPCANRGVTAVATVAGTVAGFVAAGGGAAAGGGVGAPLPSVLPTCTQKLRCRVE